MLVVLLVAFITYQYKDPSVALVGTLAYVVASFVDGVVFSKMRRSNLPVRLLVSNVFAAVCDAGVFIAGMALQGHMAIDWVNDGLLVFMEILPGLIVFILGMYWFSDLGH